MRFAFKGVVNSAQWMIVIVICLVFLSAGAVIPVQAVPAGQHLPIFTPANCMFDMPAGWQEGVQVDCGYLTVPEQYAVPDGPTIRLAVAILRSQDPDKRPDPLVMLQGGPGGSTIDTYTQILPAAERFPGNRDVILFDQRGTLYSQPPLTCSEFIDLTIDTLDQDLTDEESTRLSLQALQDCRKRLVDEGINLNAYDSLENAADIESLRTALGYDQINLYGVSYGTLLALHVMRDHPQGLRSVILDSVVPTQTNFVLGAPQAENRSFEALFKACAEDAECDASYPELRQAFYGLIDQLNENPVNIEIMDFMGTGEVYTALMDGDSLLSTVFQLMHISEFIPLIPRVIYDVRSGEWGFIERILPLFVFDRTMSYGMYYSVLCAEDADFSLSEYVLDGLPDQIIALEDDSAQYLLDACSLWNVETLGPEVDAPVESDIPTLVLSGNFDPITPPDYALEAAQGLSNSFFLLFPAGSHGNIGGDECSDDILFQFLDDPTRAPDASCIEKSEKVDFSTRASLIRLPVLIKLLNLQGGIGWQLLLYLLALVFFFTALLVYPVSWLVGLAKRKPKPIASSYPQLSMDAVEMGPPAGPAPKPFLYRIGPWAAFLTAGAMMLFTGILIAIIFNLALSNDVSILLGLPGSTRPLFLLPLLALVLTLIMFFGAIAGWARRSGSVWARLYLTLLSFAALVCIGILFVWGMLVAFFG